MPLSSKHKSINHCATDLCLEYAERNKEEIENTTLIQCINSPVAAWC